MTQDQLARAEDYRQEIVPSQGRQLYSHRILQLRQESQAVECNRASLQASPFSLSSLFQYLERSVELKWYSSKTGLSR
jgi:hypothetical protein